MRTLGATLVAVALVLVAAVPASAVTGGFGVAKAIHAGPLPVLPALTTRAGKLTSCHASGPQSSRRQASNFALKIGKKAAPVACEQPPRGQVAMPDALRHAITAAMAAIG
jgi:hypothetical protein